MKQAGVVHNIKSLHDINHSKILYPHYAFHFWYGMHSRDIKF